MTKVLAVKYPSSTDRVRQTVNHLRQVFDVPDVNKIKELFGTLLFNDNNLYRYNYCLVRFDNKLYVIEPVDLVKCTYVRKAVDYHPLSDMI
jgi:hypothetical protein